METSGQVLTPKPSLPDASSQSDKAAAFFIVKRATHRPGQGAKPTARLSTDAPELTALLHEGSALDSVSFLDDASEALAGLRGSAAADALVFGFVEAADFAGRVEELARTLEYVQIVAAHAVERTRNQEQLAQRSSAQYRQASAAGATSAAAAAEKTGIPWLTGWAEPAEPSERAEPAERAPDSATESEAAPGPGPVVGSGLAAGAGLTAGVAGARAGAGSVLDDGYRNAAEFLRARLRIGIGEARRRLALSADVLPGTGMTGQQVPARREHLAKALAAAQIPSRSATIIATALEKIQHLTDQDTITRMEQALTTTATQSDPDFVTTMTRRWTDRIDQDGPEPSEETLRHTQGAFLRRRRRYGLHHLEIFATAEQYETLTTAMNTATNPRLTTTGANTTEPGTSTNTTKSGTAEPRTSDDAHSNTASATHSATTREATPGPVLDRRSRAQKLLDGLVGACAVAMTTGKLPTNGGLRPQLTVTIDHRDLLNTIERYTHTAHSPSPNTNTDTTTEAGTGPHTGPGISTATSPGISTGTATFTGPMHPNTIRKIACDADIIPVLLGTDSQILDIGRSTRLFPPHIRKAITARDHGCAFPDCTMPAPWCETHHITYWSHGGTTGTENGTLLCSHHHHLIHKEQWRITIDTDTPWFIPPPHIDPHQTPRRNHHHTPLRT